MAETKLPRSAGPNPIVPSQNMKNVEIAYDLRSGGVFRVTMVVQAELSVPKPKAAQTAQMITVRFDGATAIRKSPMLCATIPTIQIIKSPPLSWILPAIGLETIKIIE